MGAICCSQRTLAETSATRPTRCPAPDGTIVIAGHTCSTDYPTTPSAYSPAMNGHCDAFVTGLRPDGSSLAFSTFIGGPGFAEDYATGVSVRPSGEILLVGTTSLPGFPLTADAAEPVSVSGLDGFICRLSSDASALLYSSYFGTSFGPNSCAPLAIASAPDGTVLVSGTMVFSSGTSLPASAGGFQPTAQGGEDTFVCRLDSTGKTFLKSTYFGGFGNEEFHEMRLDPAGRIYLAGQTTSPNFPLTPTAFDASFDSFCGADGYVAVLDPDLAKLRYSSFIGFSPHELHDGRVRGARPVRRRRNHDRPGQRGLAHDARRLRHHLWRCQRLLGGAPAGPRSRHAARRRDGGSAGVPALTLDGQPVPGDAVTLRIRHAKPAAPALLVVRPCSSSISR